MSLPGELEPNARSTPQVQRMSCGQGHADSMTVFRIACEGATFHAERNCPASGRRQVERLTNPWDETRPGCV